MSRLLEDLSGPEIPEKIKSGSVLILPMGATEQHGPHLPLGVDSIIAFEVASAAVGAFGEELDLWQLPTLTITKSNEHAWSAGTLWISPETLLAVLGDIGRSVAATGAERLVFLNAHGGNSSLLGVACRELRLEYGLKTFLVHPFVPPDQAGIPEGEESQMDIHGGHGETSIMLHLRPELVDMSKTVRNIPDGLLNTKFVRFGGSATFGWLSNDFGPDGHIGDPTNANPETGKKLFEAAVAQMGEQLREIAVFNFGK